MRNIPSLKNSREFQAVYGLKQSYANKYLIMYMRKNDTDESRIGISVSKKVGNSIVRHHLTRLIRESFRLNRDSLKAGYDIIVVARPQAKEQGFSEIEGAYIHLLKKLNLFVV